MKAVPERIRLAAENSNSIAWLRVPRQWESSQNEDAFKLLVYGGYFDSFDDHPRIHKDIHTHEVVPDWRNHPNETSSAAGAWQITETSWNDFTDQCGAMPFTPENQALCALWLTDRAGALIDVLAGRIDAAVRKCAKVWTSLAIPKRQQEAPEIFAAYGGKAEVPQAAPEVVLPQTVTPEAVTPAAPAGKGIMAPLILPLLEVASSLIPALGKLFGSGTEVSDRNVAAASIVADTLVKTTQAVNLQDAVEKLQSDPAVLQAAREAVSDVLYTLGEAGGGGINGARTYNLSEGPPLYKRGDFWFSLLLFLIPFLLVLDVLFFHPSLWGDNQRTQVLTAGLALLSFIGGYWLGSTIQSARKTELLAQGARA